MKSETASLPAPTGGLNARDALANMPETDAVVLDNWFPQNNSVVRRGGSVVTCDDFGAESLMAYNGLTSSILLGASGSTIFTATASDGLPTYYTTATNARFQHVNFATSGGKFMYMVNGADNALLFNGTTITAITGVSTPAITGVNTNTFIHVNSFKKRLWFTEKDSTKIWYLPVDSIGGAATSFDFGSLFRRGGYLVGMVTWTVNDTNGTDEYAVFVSSEGECLVYQGTDPSSAATWALRATFVMGRPVGRRFYKNVASDVYMITTDGVVALTQSLLLNRSQVNATLSDKIRDLIQADTVAYKNNFGWELCFFPAGQKIICNVPQTTGSSPYSYQYVMNSDTGMWCTFNYIIPAWNAYCFEVMNDKLYYGDQAKVYQADVVGASEVSDNGTPIYATVQGAFSYFGARGQQKYLTMVRPTMQFDGEITVDMSILADYSSDGDVSSVVLSNSGGTGTLWNDSFWNDPAWASPNSINSEWRSLANIGYSLSLKMTTSCTIDLKWIATDYVFQRGGVL